MTNMKVFEDQWSGTEKQDGRISHGDQLLYTGRKGNRKIYCLSRTQSKRRMGRLKAIGS